MTEKRLDTGFRRYDRTSGEDCKHLNQKRSKPAMDFLMTAKTQSAFLLMLGLALAPVARAGDASPHAVAEAFNRALATGDEKAARTLLLPDVLIYESGGAETSAAEYVGHHLTADIAFMSQMKRTQLSQSSGGEGTTAWVATRSRLTGRFKDKDIDLDSTETLVMTQTKNGWRIAHIHWSSRPAPAGK